MRGVGPGAALLGLAGLVLAACGTTGPTEPGGASAAEINAKLGVAYMLQGNNDWALSKLQKALRQDPDNATAHHYLGELYHRLGKLEDAERHFRRALAVAPDDLSLQNNYGVFLCARGRYAEAEEYFLRVLENPLNEDRAGINENLGLCALRQDDAAKAERYLRAALKINPKLPKALLGLAQLSVQQEEYLRARGFLQRHLDLAPHSPQSLWTGIQIERRLGNRDALASYTLLLKGKFPDAVETARLLELEARGQ